jgi:hypothetical protein
LLDRRDLTPEQKSYYRGKEYLEKKRQGERTDLEETYHQNYERLKISQRPSIGLGVAAGFVARIPLIPDKQKSA